MIDKSLTLGLSVAALIAAGTAASAQPAPGGAAQPPAARTTPFATNWTRIESWRFFEPPPGGGDPTYADVGNRLQFGVRRTTRRYEATVALQYVQFGGLPRSASGPGPLGVGALYFDHSGRTDSRQLYLRFLNVRLKELLPGFSVQVGRMGYTSGAEAASGVPKVEAVKRQHVDSRLLGDFEWSLYQRAYDGARLDWAGSRLSVTAAAFRPTQGGFENAAGVTIDDIGVVTGSVTFRPGTIVPRTEWQTFVTRYDDRRDVGARPDNTGRSAARVDVGVASVGTTLVGAYSRGSSEIDALVWLVAQAGRWYGQAHRAYAVAAEAGYQWSQASWRPWVRAGFLRASGDADARDDRHGTFFQMLPTVRRYSLSATYSQMNLVDAFGQLMLRPQDRVNIRIDVHRVSLAEAADRWYAGSGATQQRGTIFGFAGRSSQGATGLGTVIEGSFDWRFTRRWSINGYVGVIKGGEVVRRTFRGDRLTFAYLENVLQF